ncbi:MAG TPA: [FeFe] hydrogenase H-cluster maturation GTPase HydF [Ruminococcaceae bacterium]|nr:[FeFe] hydrogenase H-cluster maturation GTPase HydF [Oscillospiraceae bacterium]
MQGTPRAMLRHAAITGGTNAGKSSLFNALLGQSAAIVSGMSGTTTDPVIKSMELIPYGPVAFIDTAGMDDKTPLGGIRMEKTKRILRRCDLIIHLTDASRGEPDPPTAGYPVIEVFSKADLLTRERLAELREKYPDALFMRQGNNKDLDALKARVIAKLTLLDKGREQSLLGGLLSEGAKLMLVIPADSEAPKGRLILPQSRLLREALDSKMLSLVTRETELEKALAEYTPELVVTDSQVFAEVDAALPKNIPLTSFSMLLAFQNGDFQALLNGARHIDSLKDGARILMLEGCTHNHTHEDIGRVKIPAALKKLTGKEFYFTHVSGYDFPEDFGDTALVIQCGGCMLADAEIKRRMSALKAAGLPVTNYGMTLAHCAGILERASEIFNLNGE